MNILRLLVLLSFVVVNSSATAQTTAAAPAAAPAASPCVKPGHYPGKKASDTRKEAWMNEMRAWGKCTTAYRDDLRAQIDALVKLANSTTEEYNAGLKELQEEQKAAEEGK
jgi:hypothetical protein